MTRAIQISCIAIILSIGFFAYSGTLGHEFLHWDDYPYYVNNKHIHSISWENLYWMLTGHSVQNWHPITWLSFSLDYALWGKDPYGPHLTNIILHLVNAVLVFYLTRSILKDSDSKLATISAYISMLLFVIHPQHVETVAWISDRKSLLASIFIITAIIFYTSSNQVLSTASSRITITVLYIFAMMSKPIAVTLPAILVACDIFPLKKIHHRGWATELWRSIKEKSVLWFLAGVFICMTMLTQYLGGAVQVDRYELTHRLVNSSVSFWFYIQQWALPNSLSPFHPYSGLSAHPHIIPWIPSFFILAALATTLYLHKVGFYWPLALFIYYMVSLIPVIGLIQVGIQGAAERYTYVPNIVFFILFSYLISRYILLHSYTKYVAIIVLSSYCVYLFTETTKYIPTWSSDRTLWQRVILQYPQTPMAHINLGNAFFTEGDVYSSIDHYKKSLEIEKIAIAYANLSHAYFTMGRHGDANEILIDGIHAFPNSVFLTGKLADTKLKQNDFSGAEELYKKAISIDQHDANLYLNLAKSQIRQMKVHDAKITLDYALNIFPEHQEIKRMIKLIAQASRPK